MNTINRLRYRLVTGSILVAICLSFISPFLLQEPASATGETYKWINANNITASGGRYAQPLTLKASKPYTPGKDNIPDFISSDPGFDTSGCAVYFNIKFTGKANNKAKLVDMGATVPVLDCLSDVTDKYDKNITLSNTGGAGEAGEKITITVRSVVAESETFPAESDTITLKNMANGKELGKKKVTKSYKSDTAKGFEATFDDMKTNIRYEACSDALGKCEEKTINDPGFSGGILDELDKIITIGDTIFSDSGDEETTTSCAVDGIGWIVCPVITFLGTLNDAAFGFLNNFLTVSPKIFSDPATKSAWEAFRNLANIAFVVAFLVIIYSQITGGGITNYGLKKLLPKLIVAAILVNISFYVCAVLVDLSNIVGSSTYSLLKNDINTGTGDAGGGALSDIWSKAGAVVLGAGAVVGLIALIIFAPMSFLAFGLIILILIARQAFVVLLIVISPLAFVAYLLPNTEDWFKKWWKSLVAMLMVFPIIALVFGGSTLASTILMSVSQDNFGGGDDEQMLKIIAAGVLAIPLFAVPLLLKGSMSAAGTIGTKLAGLQGRATGAAGKGAKEGLKRRAENVEARMAGSDSSFARMAGGYRNRRAFRRKSTETDTSRRQEEALSEHVRDNPRYNTRQQATAYQAVDKAWEDEVKAHQALYSSKSTDEQTLLSHMNDSSLTQQQRAAAAGALMKGSRKGQNSAVRAAVTMAQSGEDVSGIQKQMAYDMGSRVPMGLGAGARAELGRGKLGVDQAEGEDKPPGTDAKYSFDDEIANRAVAKVSAAGIPDLDPDDLQEILNAAKAGRIQGDDLETLHQSINTAKGDERINTRINDSSRAYLDQISSITKKDAQNAAAKTYGDNI